MATSKSPSSSPSPRRRRSIRIIVPSTDGTSDKALSPPARPSSTKMNNFNNFDNGQRQAPGAAQQQPQHMNGVAQWPNVGAQSDMNVLWEYISKLSEMHEQIRVQTQAVATGMGQIEGLRVNGAGAGVGGHVNGVINGLPPTSSESSEIARLQHELATAQSRNEDLTNYISTLQALNTDYENAISHTLDKLRPFAQSHSLALVAQKAHYLHLLEAERKQNLELRLEQSRWQEQAKRIKDDMIVALKLQSESEVGFVKKIARLKADNRSLRRICGVPLMEESEDDEEGEVAFVGEGLVKESSARQSPEMERKEGAV